MRLRGGQYQLGTAERLDESRERLARSEWGKGRLGREYVTTEDLIPEGVFEACQKEFYIMSCHDSEALGVRPCLELAYVEEIAPHLGLGDLKCTIPPPVTVLNSSLVTRACSVSIDTMVMLFYSSSS